MLKWERSNCLEWMGLGVDLRICLFQVIQLILVLPKPSILKSLLPPIPNVLMNLVCFLAFSTAEPITTHLSAFVILLLLVFCLFFLFLFSVGFCIFKKSFTFILVRFPGGGGRVTAAYRASLKSLSKTRA